MIPILQIISVAVGITAPTHIGTPIFNATNRVGLSFKLYFIATVIASVLMLLGSHWGLMGVAWSRLLIALVGLVFFRISLGLVDLNSKHIWQIMGGPCVAAGVMWGLIGLARDPVVSWTATRPLQLAVLIGSGVLIYILTCLLVAPTHVRDAKDVMNKLRPGR